MMLFGRPSDAARAQIRPTRDGEDPRIPDEGPYFDIVGEDEDGQLVVLEYACPGVRTAQRRIDYLQPLNTHLIVRMRRI